MARFIFITGGVVSSLGKGLMAASLAALLQARGYSVRIRKFDPYLNVDPGTMSPYQHGEVYVTDDGAETDLDLGHYERFTGVAAHQSDNVTSGRIYHTVITRERRGDYLGATVQVIPHVTDAIKAFARADTIDDNGDELDFVLCEIGGTVGDIESLPFIESIRQLKNELGRGRSISIHVTLVPYIAAAGELKTKPTQHSVREIAALGVAPDVLVCRCEQPLPPSGDYRCRTVKLGRRGAVGLGYVAYPWFRCWVGERGEFVRLDGSQRQVGRFFADTDARAVFLGTMALGDERSPIAYARDPQRDLAGVVERIGERRWRIAFPFPAFESKLDVIEVVPG